MSRAVITEGLLTDIADAIREKLDVQDTYTPPQMAAAIESIPTGGITPTGTKNITKNGTHDVTQYASANVNVQPNLQSKTVTENGTVTPDQGYDGLSSVTVNVSGESVAVYIVSQEELRLMKGSNKPSSSYIKYDYQMPYRAISWFQNDTVSFYGSSSEAYFQVSRGNNKVIQFFPKIPARCTKLYLDISADAGSENYPISSLYLVDSVGITGYYAGNWSGTTLRSYTLTNTSVGADPDWIKITRTSARVVPRQVVEIDISDINVDCYFTYFGCRSYFNVWGIWAE